MAIRLDISENQEQTALEIESEDAVRSVDISENQAQAPLRVGAKGLLRTITPDNGSPYYVGARAYVTQNEDGATVTVIDKDGTTTADIDDGYSPSASVSKVGTTATITITDKNGTTTATVKDGSGQGLFIAEYGVTTYADVKSAFEAEQDILCKSIGGDTTYLLPCIGFDDDSDTFAFCSEWGADEKWAMLASDDTWDDWNTSIAQVQADWNENALDSPAYILNKPTIPARDIWYGTSSTASSTGAKVVTTASGGFTLTAGNMLCVLFSTSNAASNVTLAVDGQTATSVQPIDGTSNMSYRWRANEAVMFLYNGSKFIMLEQGTADTSWYGITKLNNTTSSTSTTEAATANAVKLAYDHGGVTDVEVDGTSVLNGTVAEISTPTVIEPTISITASVGTVYAYQIRQWGKVVMLRLQVQKSTATAGGANLFEGTLNTAALLPVVGALGVGFYGARSFVGYISTTGTMTVRNASSTSLPALSGTDNVAVEITYIVE